MLKEALEMAKKENEELIGYKQQLAEIENARREKLINSLPEEKREKVAEFDTKALEELSEVYSGLNKSDEKPSVNITNAPAQRGKPALKKDWTTMTVDEKRSNWSSIMDSYKK